MDDKFTVHTPEGNVEKHGGQREVFRRVATVSANAKVEQ
jgi:hypothetical protein